MVVKSVHLNRIVRHAHLITLIIQILVSNNVHLKHIIQVISVYLATLSVSYVLKLPIIVVNVFLVIIKKIINA